MNTNTNTKSRKNLITSVVAGAAGVALLAGGTTFALWHDSGSVEGTTITAGTLDIVNTPTISWKDVSVDVNGGDGQAIPNIEDFRVVPGDKLEATASIDVDVEGNNLRAILVPDLRSLDYSGSLTSFLDLTQASLTYTPEGGSAVPLQWDGSTEGFEIPSEGEGTITATVTFAFDANDQDAIGTNVTLDDIVFDLVQDR